MTRKSEKNAELLPTHHEAHGQQLVSWLLLIKRTIIGLAFLVCVSWICYRDYMADCWSKGGYDHDYNHNGIHHHDLAATSKHKVALEAHIMYVME